MQTLAPIVTEFLCVTTELQLGFFVGEWKVVWCEPDHNRIVCTSWWSDAG